MNANLPNLVEEADAIIGAFFAYAADSDDCGLLTVKSTDPGHRCTCGFSEWNRRAGALRSELRGLKDPPWTTRDEDGTMWVLCPPTGQSDTDLYRLVPADADDHP